jgi:autotransporter-associated beta strand protein
MIRPITRALFQHPATHLKDMNKTLPNQKLNAFLLLAGLAVLTLIPHQANGQSTLYNWYASPPTLGGTGGWSTAVSATNWSTNGSTFVNWTNLSALDQSNAIARFGGTAGTVSFFSSYVAHSLDFVVSDYTLQSGSGTTRTLTLASGNVTVGAGILATFGSSFRLSGTNGFTKLGDGTLVLGNTANTTSGANVINAGVVKLGVNQGLANTALTVSNGATLDLAGFQHLVGATGATLSGSGTITSSVAGGLLSYESTTSSDFSGVLSGSLSLAKSGGTSSTLTLSGSSANTYSGDTLVSIGNLTLNKAAGINAVGGNLIIGDGGSTTRTVSLSAANQIADTSVVTISNSGRFNLNGNSETIGALTGGVAGVGSVSLSGATLTIAGAAEGNFAGNIALGTSGVLEVGGASNATISGIISSSTGSLAKSGSGTLILSGTNTYGGGTVISNGLLQLGSGSASGSIVGNITNNGALSVNRSDSYSLTNQISGSGSLIMSGSGTTTITGTNSYTGATAVNSGTLVIAASAVISSSSSLAVSNSATLDLGGRTQTVAGLRGAGNVTNSSGILTVNTGSSNSFSGVISGAGGLTKSGVGILSLSGSNTFTGSTLVEGGRLAVDGSLSSAVTVTNTGVLGGSGVIGGAVTMNGGTLAPGNSIESLAMGELTLNNGSTFAMELDSSAGLSLAGDFVKVSGNLNLNDTVYLTLTDLASSPTAFDLETTFTLINYSGAWDGGFFTLGTTSLTNNSTFTVGLNTWQITYNATNGGENFAGEYFGDGSSYVNIAAVPEPSTYALLVLSGLGLAAYRWRSRARHSASRQ